MRLLTSAGSKRDIIFTANTGHELGHTGLSHYLRHHESLITDAMLWIPEDPNLLSLPNRHQYELKNPAVFSDMCQFHSKPVIALPSFWRGMPTRVPYLPLVMNWQIQIVLPFLLHLILQDELAHKQTVQTSVMNSQDRKEGGGAFIEKRKANWPDG